MKRLDGLKLIAAWLHLSMRQVRKLTHPSTAVDVRIPVYRLTDGRCTRVSADVADLEAWVARRKEATSNLRPDAAQRATSSSSRGSRRPSR
jgi:hypothetical protein